MGIKDTNDELVALTLRSLAELVPLLGSATVIGGKRAKLFTDGRPVVHITKTFKQKNHTLSVKSSTSPISNSTPEPTNISLVLPERPQPDGEEVDTSTDEVEQSADEDLETWEDWDANESSAVNNSEQILSTSTSEITVTTSLSATEPDLLQGSSVSSGTYEAHRKISLPDITELDIKNQRNSAKYDEEVDFFQDMEPVIECKPRFTFADGNGSNESHPEVETVKKLSLNVDVEETTEDGWGEEEWD